MQPFRSVLEPLPPLGRETGDGGQFGKVIEGRPMRHLNLPELLDGEPFGVPIEKSDLVTRANVSRAHDPVIPAGDSCLRDEHRHLLHTETVIDLPAWTTRLRHLQHGTAHPEYVPNVHVPLGHVVRRHVLAKAARYQRRRALRKGLRKQAVVLRSVLMDSFLRPAVHPGIAMFVAHDAQRLDTGLPGNATFIDPCELPLRFEVFEPTCEEMLNA